MKLNCSVLSAADHGDKLLLKLQGAGVAEFAGAAWAPQEMMVPMTDRNKRTFHVGRRVTVEIKPRGKR